MTYLIVLFYIIISSVLESFKNNIPRIFHAVGDTMPSFVEVSYVLYSNKFLNWQVEHAKWNFGESSLSSLINRCKEFKEVTITGRSRTLAANDMYYDKQLGFKYLPESTPKEKKLIIFDKKLLKRLTVRMVLLLIAMTKSLNGYEIELP
ncbi:MAG: hypothetical protein ACLRIR_08125 [Streptococcus salivarius]